MNHSVLIKRRELIKRIALLTSAMALPMVSTAALASRKKHILSTRLYNYKGYSKYAIHLDGLVEHSIFTLKNPNRLVIDIKNVVSKASIAKKLSRNPIVSRIRFAPRNGTDLRIVLDLSPKAISPSSLIKKISSKNGKSVYRLEINVNTSHYVAAEKKAKKQKIIKKQRLRDVIVAIDAGHGGRDPGAIGRHGTKEKEITLQIAKRLQQEMSRHKGIKVRLIRNRDKYMSLRSRMNKARRMRADLFISLHADSFRDPRASGASVYALSMHGASSEAAKLLAQKENSVDLFGKVSLRDKDAMLASVLLDMSQDSTIQSSLEAGDKVLHSLKSVGKVHKHTVQQAGFAVLKSPDIPSILIETAFISNPKEERKLRNRKHQQKIAKAVTRGVKDFFKTQALPGTVFSQVQV